jgi:Tfp pilus assembly protein PilF
MRGLIEDSRRAAEKAEGRRLSDAEVSAWWSARARERITSDTGGWLALLGRKALLFWNGGELGDIVDLELMKEEAPVFRLLVVRFALISALSFTGILLVFRYGHGRWPLLLFTAASMAAIVLFYFNTRYRLPSLPVLAASAGYLVSWTAGMASVKRWKEISAAILVCAIFFATVSGRRMFEVNRSATYAFLGNHYMSEGNGEKALEAFREAYTIDPESVENMINLARGLSRAGDSRGAGKYYRLAWETDPDFPRLALEYGYLLDEEGKREEAVRLYNHAWNSGSRNEKITAAKLMSRMAYAAGDRETAIDWIRKALEIAPGDKELLRLLKMLEGP